MLPFLFIVLEGRRRPPGRFFILSVKKIRGRGRKGRRGQAGTAIFDGMTILAREPA